MFNKNIYLFGFMGAGKTTTGLLLNKQYQRLWIDLDDYIEQKYHQTAAEIIEEKSIKTFRKYEEEAFFSCIENQNCIISLGGGSLTNDSIFNFLKNEQYTFYLQADIQILYDRIKNDKKSIRPLALQKNLEELEILLQEREERYLAAAKYIIDANQSSENIISQISNVL